MAALVTGEKARMYALSKIERSGATRSGYTSPTIFVTIAGVQVAANRAVATQLILQDTLTITEREGATPNTASFTVKGFIPTDGQDVVITRGSQNRTGREFAGTILTDAHGYVGTPANGNDQINVVDYTWQLTRETITQRWTNVSGTVIAQDIITHAGRGFTATMVAAGLAVLDEFTVTNQTHAQALTSLCQRLGTTWKSTYLKEVQLGLTADPTQADPTPITAASALLTGVTAFTVTRDLSPVITRQPVEGGGANALTDLGIGETSLPVTDVLWYNGAGGGTVVSGPQRLTYTGVQVGGGGGLVGPGVVPSAAPSLAAVAGTGLGLGVFQYAYTDVTAAGESLPSPLGTVTTIDAPTPATPIDAGDPSPEFANGNLGSPGDTVSYKVTFGMAASPTDYTQDSPASAVMTTTLTASVPFPSFSKGKLITLTYSNDVNVKWIRLWAQDAHVFGGGYGMPALFLTPSQGSISGIASDGSIPNIPGGGTITILDGYQRSTAPPTGSAHYNQVAVAGIALGPAGVTSRKVYRTAAGGSQLKLQQTIANNTATVGVQDATADGSLGANAPTSDTSGLTQPTGQVNAGSTTLLLAGAGAFSTGWAIVGSQVIKYTGVSGNTLTGIPASGTGSIGATITYNTTVVAAAALTGIPASGAGSILYPIKRGDPVNLRVVVDDLTAQAVITALMLPTVDDGVIEGPLIQDGRISETEARSRATAQLALKSQIAVSINFTGQDTNLHAGRTQAVNLTVPPVVGSFKLQSVMQTNFQPAIYPQRTCVGAVTLLTLSDLFRTLKGG